MHKKKTSKKQEFCFEDMPILGIKKNTQLKAHHPEKSFKNFDKVGAALLESLMENDTQTFIEILEMGLQ